MTNFEGVTAPDQLDPVASRQLAFRAENREDHTLARVFSWRCPACHIPLPAPDCVTTCASCGRQFDISDGVWRFLLPEREMSFSASVARYTLVRSAEGWGSNDPTYYRSLPNVPQDDRWTGIWRIRQSTFRTLMKNVVIPLEKTRPGGLVVLDLGAGNGWLSNHLASRGHSVAAIDLTVDERDGLGAAKHYRDGNDLSAGAGFLAVQAEYDNLPFQNGQADLVIFDASLHYSHDYDTTLGEAARLLRLGGTVAILDTPSYSTAAQGVAMVRERESRFHQTFGLNNQSDAAEGFLDDGRWGALRETTELTWRRFEHHGVARRSLQRLMAKSRRTREPATFPLLVGLRTGKPHRPPGDIGVMSRVKQRLSRLWLRWQFRLFQRSRLDQTVTETIVGREISVFPSVFNPAIFRSGRFLAEAMSAARVPPGSVVLDLGTGSGIGAIVASEWAARVVAVDINPNAVRCARFNVDRHQLASKIEVREGDLFEPVRAERFDVVLFNPPFYLGAPIDDFDRAWHSVDVVERFAGQLDEFLIPGGRALVVLSTDGETKAFVQRFRAHGWLVRPVSVRHYANESFTLYRLTRESEGSDARSL